MSVMEDYEHFARRLSHLRRREEEKEEERSEPSAPSSLIRVHGRAILPPLLSEKQRGEMQRHRNAAQKAAGHRKLEEDPRKAYVQNLLNHVQLVRIPTLEELLQESETAIPSLQSQHTSGGSECHVFSETAEDRPLLSPPSLASSVSSAFHISSVTSQESSNGSCRADQQDSKQGSQPSCPNAAIPRSASSGYTPLTSGTIDAGSGSCGSSEGTYGMDAFFLSSSTNTITRMPEISIHPPLDGEELEISGLDSSLSDDSIAEYYICNNTFQDDSGTCDNITAANSERSHPESKDNEHNTQSTGICDLESDLLSNRSEEAVSLLEDSNFSESSDTLSAPCSQRRAEHAPADAEPTRSNANKATPSDNHHRSSIQALLRRSQEYRQQQRMLRSQAKNTKVQKRNQEPRRRPEEQSLSDKENDVSVAVTPEERKTRVIDTEFPEKMTDVKSESQRSTGVTVINGEPIDGLQTSTGEVVLNAFLQDETNETNLGPPHSHATVPSTVVVPGALRSNHMGQLESDLSTLKEVIANLEHRLKEDLENPSQTKSCRESERRLKGVKHSLHITNEQPVQLHQNGWDTSPDVSPGGADSPLQGSSGMPPPPVERVSAAQQMRVPDVSRNFPTETAVSCDVSVLSDTSNHPADRRKEVAGNGHDTPPSQALNKSYDVNTPSFLWLRDKSGSDSGSVSLLVEGEHLTPERGDEGQGKGSKVKRRLLMHTAEEINGKSPDTNRGGGVVKPRSTIPKAAAKNQEQLKQVHAAQIQALQDDHKQQQEQLLQAFAARYHLLHRVSTPWSVSASRLRDTMTFSTLHQPSSALSERCCHLLSAAVKGYLTRRLLRTERVARLVRTIRDTQKVLLGLLLERSNKGEAIGRQDLMLQDRVSLQLRAARFELSDIFFSLTAKERMQLISWDRYLIKEREFRQQSGDSVHTRQKSCLSAFTQKALERKRGAIMAQKKTVQTQKKVVKKTGHRNGFKTGLCVEKPKEAKRGQFRANPLRVPKNSYSP